MKLISSRVYVCFMLFFALLCGAQNAMADNTISVQPFSLDGYATVNVPVALTNSDAITQIQFDVVLPNGLYMSGNPVKNNERLTQHQLTTQQSPVYTEEGEYVGTRYRLLIVSLQSAAVEGNSGTIVTLPIHSNSNIEQGNTQISIENIVMTDKAATTFTQPNFNVEVSLLNCEFSVDNDQFIVVPGKTQALKINLKNNFPVYGAEFDIVVPEGFSVETTTYEFSDRVDQSLAAPIFNLMKDGAYRFILTGLTTEPLVSVGEGDFLTIYVAVPDSYTGDTPVNIVVKNSTLSYVTRWNGVATIYGAYPPELTIPVVNGNIALDKANEVVSALEADLAAALETIATECPDVADNYTGEEIAEAIENLSEAIQTAYENGTLTPNYDEVMAPAEGIGNDIDALVADAVAAQKAYVDAQREAANKAAYDADIKSLDALQEQLNITKTVVAVQYPGVDVAAKVKEAQDAIDAARAAAQEAYEAVETEGTYEYEVPVDDITAAINAIPAEAKRIVDNEAAYKADVKTIDQLEKKLDASYDQVIVDYPEVSLEDIKPAYDAAKEAIDAARAAANEAYAAVISEGNYDYDVPVDEIEALIKEIRIAAENAGINDITVDALPEDFRMFNLQGVEIENPAPGSVVIIRNTKGISRKVLVM